MDREGRGKEESMASVKRSHDPVQMKASESCGQESRAVFRGGEKGQPSPLPGAGALRRARLGPRCLTLGDHGHPESQRQAQTSMLGSLRPCPAPLPLHAMCPGGLSTHLATCFPWPWAHRALRGGREQGVGRGGLGTYKPSSEQDGWRAWPRTREGRRGLEGSAGVGAP